MNEHKNKTNKHPPKLEMKIDIRVLEHLGLKMYTSLPAVIAEYVANCWDAGATLVNITIPKGPIDENYIITIDDNGQGMSIEEVNRKFLVVGRRRREEEGTDTITVNGKPRRVIGRKGLGKLAGFGVAGRVEVRTRKNGRFIEFRMDYDDMQRKLAEEDTSDIKTTYSPEVLDWGSTTEPNGTTVKLTHLKRSRPVSVVSVRRNLARHFSVLGEDFIVKVNDEPLSPAERELKQQCEYVWPYDNTIIDEKLGLTVNGWIGTMKKTVPPDIERGIVVMARGKLVQTPTTFDVGGKGITGQHALAYLVGEIHAEFLDEEEDLIATGRRSVIWEKEPAATLRQWLNKEIKRVCAEWAEKRKEKKMTKIRELPIYKERIAKLPSHEKKIIDSFLGKMAQREEVDEGTIEKIADFLASGVEYTAFLNLVEAIEEAGVSKPEALIEFFNEWEVLDAIEMIRVVEGRLEAMSKFQELVRIRAKEVPTLHNFLRDNPWLLDPTWDYMDDEVTYRDLLLKKFPESENIPEENKRIDFLCLGYGNTLNVVELKRPGSTIGWSELEQLEKYVDYIRSLFGSDSRSYQAVVGYIIGGHVSNDARNKMERLSRSSMFVRTYKDLQRVAKQVHRRFIEVLERKSKRIIDKRLHEGLKRLKEKFKEVEVAQNNDKSNV